MRDTVYFLAFDGFADWEAALALCEIRRPGDWRVVTVGFSHQPVLSMAGLRVLPEITLDQMDLARAALFVIPGGHMWEHGYGDEAIEMAVRVHSAGAPVAAISSGVLALARAGLLERCRHTGNLSGFIGRHVPDYAGVEQYDPDVLAVSDGGVITASGLGSVEFAREIIRTLDLYSASDREHWYRLFKHAVPPPWFAGEKAVAA
ncbi:MULTISPECIES: DJ-1/PfpI family protein [Dyella]|uniref:Thiamine biosynthesis protein ThiJ n=2 Tax=Dyella TaxID=231454 RepID=A0A4R0YJG2_9GAMM|nr:MULTISPECIES: DJ-1/PfpI family protein [Dyella]TBR35842.1 thiamine biosynthesis protein ThiJ [Dyella terrae]TCI08610.1 thiamine biosynthesis protein ThiJ [Dyella soli]